MNIKTTIQEILSSPYKIFSKNHQTYTFTTDKNIEYIVHIQNIPLLWRNYPVNGLSISFSAGEDIYITGTKDAFRVITTVYGILMRHVDSLTPFVTFITFEKSRINLYKRLYKRYMERFFNLKFIPLVFGTRFILLNRNMPELHQRILQQFS